MDRRAREADVARLKRELSTTPRDPVRWHNLAAAQGDLGDSRDAEESARRAIALGLAAPETRLVLARALQDLGRLDEAEGMFLEALARRPGWEPAHRDLAQLRWMRTGDRARAVEAIDRELIGRPADGALHVLRSIVLEVAGDLDGALDSARQALKHAPRDGIALRHGAHIAALVGDRVNAVDLARRAVALAPREVGPQVSLIEALLAAGEAREAASVADAVLVARPTDQHLLALRSTAWRILEDPRYVAMHDYAALVATDRIATPPGWSDLDAFLADLGRELDGLHAFEHHPLLQSVRGGGQLTLNTAQRAHPCVGALLRQLQLAVDGHLARMGQGDDPLRSRNRGGGRIAGAWSVKLASGGHHTDHIHPEGWLSSAFYVRVPPEVEAGAQGRAGFLRLGKPGIPTTPPLEAEWHVKPKPGVLALFPAYMWHGVVPFASAAPRLSVAFDVVPAEG